MKVPVLPYQGQVLLLITPSFPRTGGPKVEKEVVKGSQNASPREGDFEVYPTQSPPSPFGVETDVTTPPLHTSPSVLNT